MGAVVLAVEIGLPRYNRAFRAAATRRHQQVFHEKWPVQVAVPDSWLRMLTRTVS